MSEAPVDDLASRQYDRWSYPLPITDLPGWLQKNWQWFDPSHAHRLFWPDRAYREGLRILVAGCGTSQAAVIAHTNPSAEVIAIDVSQTSLDHHRALSDRHGLSNLRLYRLAIEEVEQLAGHFDLIIATGVLHHLMDPLAGLLALARCLGNDGVIAVMLYARYGRLGVEMMQSVFRDIGFTQSQDSVEQVKHALQGLSPNHPLIPYLQIAPDLHYDAGIVDTFLHGRERSFSVGECFDLVESANLVFQDMFFHAPYSAAAMLDNPFYARVEALPARHKWSLMERINTANGCHFFTACQRQRPRQNYHIDFASPDVFSYRPALRYRCQQEGTTLRSPNGSLDLEPAECRVIQQMDGTHTIAEIIAWATSSLRMAPPSAPDPTQAVIGLMEHLWQLDFLQVSLA